MRAAILGASGGVGRWLIRLAREDRDHVKILVRDPQALPPDLGAIGIVRGDVMNPEAVAAAVGGSDVVFSALGARGLGVTTLYSRGIGNALGAMRESGISRLLVVSAGLVEDDPSRNILERRGLRFVFRNLYGDMALMEREIENSGFAYTIVRPARLTDGPRTGLYRTNERFVPAGGQTISRADVADFMIRTVADERTIRKTIGIAY